MYITYLLRNSLRKNIFEGQLWGDWGTAAVSKHGSIGLMGCATKKHEFSTNNPWNWTSRNRFLLVHIELNFCLVPKLLGGNLAGAKPLFFGNETRALVEKPSKSIHWYGGLFELGHPWASSVSYLDQITWIRTWGPQKWQESPMEDRPTWQLIKKPDGFKLPTTSEIAP